MEILVKMIVTITVLVMVVILYLGDENIGENDHYYCLQILVSAITNPGQMSIILGAHKRKLATETSEVISCRCDDEISFALLCFVRFL